MSSNNHGFKASYQNSKQFRRIDHSLILPNNFNEEFEQELLAEISIVKKGQKEQEELERLNLDNEKLEKLVTNAKKKRRKSKKIKSF
jgi:benzoyl-CoA reductase/2-hydroxyglutaryl-CoA dehydratase subunit BcrC/BadD/HgdB